MADDNMRNTVTMGFDIPQPKGQKLFDDEIIRETEREHEQENSFLE